jgi:hypothetical protein
MPLSELLSRQSWSKIGVLGADNGKRFIGTLLLQAPITGSIPELRDKTPRTLQLVTHDQPPNLADRQPETFGDGFLFELPVDQSLNALEPIQFSHRNAYPWYPQHRRPPSPFGEPKDWTERTPKGTFLSGRKRTFLFSYHNQTTHNVYYVK